MEPAVCGAGEVNPWIWVLAYVTVGCMALWVTREVNKRGRGTKDAFAAERITLLSLLPKEDRASPPTTSQRFGKAALDSAACLLLVALWPAIPLVLGVFLWAEHRERNPGPDRPPKPVWLYEHPTAHKTRITPEEAMRLGHIHDPKGRVPALPFGHLNRAWSRFREEFAAGDQLYAVRVPDGASAMRLWGQFKTKPVDWHALALVRRNKVIREFVYQSGG